MRPLICTVISTTTLLILPLHAGGQDRLRGFGKEAGEPRIKGFGPYAEFQPKVIEADFKTARSWIAKYDRDGGGVLVSSETVSWGRDSISMYDLDRDGQMHLREIALGIAQARVKRERAAHEKARQKERAAAKQAAAEQAEADAAQASAANAPSSPVDPLILARQNMCNQLASELITQHDRNGNSQLELSEWQTSGARFGRFSGGADTNADDNITQAELAAWLIRRLPPLASERLAKPLRLLDVDRDGQITMSEYANPPSEEKSDDFRTLDQNNDGLISPKESHAPPVPEGAVGFASQSAKVINNKQEVTSSIWINEDIEIEDLDVRVAITKQDDDQMKLFLIGPDQQRITLFAGGWQPWSGSYRFESTLIDDEAPLIDTTLPQPPLPRRLRTDALKTEEPSLRHFYSKSARGTWRLVVVNMNDKVGVLHRWSLWVTPKRR